MLKETETVQESDQGTYLLGLHQDDWFRWMDQFETTRTVWSPDQQMKITLGDFGGPGEQVKDETANQRICESRGDRCAPGGSHPICESFEKQSRVLNIICA